ncbi:PREDICTED: flavin prenyltransferase UbiX-like [Trachymyrmex cornetzi]|uniref:flavin prenyltransferase UbiX-like n=1 Tax=Trachymyrmex cornetzi TaxID=471704 RepID=UPI00084EDA70|nr:PREDICTED: flavin prenyltransferase UbiX-like [Trachymyrmex cornetzi]
MTSIPILSCISSGSFEHSGMIIAPYSVKTMSSIAYGITDNLLTRAADVTLKERRPLVLMLRETPLNLSHIEAMKHVTLMGGIIAPPLNSFYIQPKSIEDLVHYSVARF